jgi:hypothetical protein
MKGHVSGKGARKHREFPMAAGELTEDEFRQFLVDAFGLMASHSVDGATLFAYMDWRHLLEIAGAVRAVGCELLNLCVWVKTNGGMGSPIVRGTNSCSCLAKATQRGSATSSSASMDATEQTSGTIRA